MRPANFRRSNPSATLNSEANVLAKAFTPAPPVWTSVPSISNRTRRTMCRKVSRGRPVAMTSALRIRSARIDQFGDRLKAAFAFMLPDTDHITA